jgi:hypothetical protein
VEYDGGSMPRLGGREKPEPGMAEHGVQWLQDELHTPCCGVDDEVIGIRRAICGRGPTHACNARLREHHDSHR